MMNCLLGYVLTIIRIGICTTLNIINYNLTLDTYIFNKALPNINSVQKQRKFSVYSIDLSSGDLNIKNSFTLKIICIDRKNCYSMLEKFLYQNISNRNNNYC